MPTISYAEVINDLADQCANMAEGKGFWDPEDVGDNGMIPLKLALIHSEASEALAVHRNEYDDSSEDMLSRMTEMQVEDFTDEMADIVIRVLDTCGFYDFPIGQAIVDKMEQNAGRPHLHSKRY